RIGSLLHHGGIGGEKQHQRQDGSSPWPRQPRQDQATRKKNQQGQKRENKLKKFETGAEPRKKKSRQLVHGRRPGWELVSENDWRVGGEVMQEEQRPLKMFQPIAEPVCSGIVPYHGQDQERPESEERKSFEGLPYAGAAEQFGKVPTSENDERSRRK